MVRGGQQGTRFAALDGLRGLAALVVVFGHLANASWPAFSNVGRPGAGVPRVGGWNWLLHRTPLEVLVAGHEAVIVFFVLSGFVLTLPLMGPGRRFDPLAYYPRRVARLYLPVWAAVAIAVLLHALVARHATSGMSWWLAGHAEPLSLGSVADAATLKLPEQFSVFTALWSLRWEMVFSVLMPLYAWAAFRGRRLPVVLVALPLIPIMLAGQRAPVAYLPCFFLGTALAARLDLVSTAQHHLAQSRASRVIARVGVLLALTAQAPLGTGNLAQHLGPVLTALGATGAVVLALADPGLRTKLHLPGVQWLGTRSFSLYLVHEPLLVTIAYLLHGALSLWVLALIALPVAAIAAEAFYRTVEQPAHRLARSLGRRLARESRASRLRSPTPADLAGLTPPPRARA